METCIEKIYTSFFMTKWFKKSSLQPTRIVRDILSSGWIESAREKKRKRETALDRNELRNALLCCWPEPYSFPLWKKHQSSQYRLLHIDQPLFSPFCCLDLIVVDVRNTIRTEKQEYIRRDLHANVFYIMRPLSRIQIKYVSITWRKSGHHQQFIYRFTPFDLSNTPFIRYQDGNTIQVACHRECEVWSNIFS